MVPSTSRVRDWETGRPPLWLGGTSDSGPGTVKGERPLPEEEEPTFVDAFFAWFLFPQSVT
jgi:hypothetical protein